jgi:uncharacterized protein YecE (DUF72 family)
MNLYVGTSGYGHKEWKGKFYPKELPAEQMLKYYGERCRAVEINNSFYRMPAVSVVKSWANDVAADFQFAIKAPQQITHMRRLKNAEEPLSFLLEVAGALKNRLGPLLFQLPPNFKKDATRLREFLVLLPSDRRATFEFRHSSWFDDEIFEILRQHHVALCIAEADDDLQIPFVATTNWGYLRLRRPEYSDTELTNWNKRVRKQDWQDVYVFFMHDAEGKAPMRAKRFLELAT